MLRFSYTGHNNRVFLYPRAFKVHPGDVVEADRNPDPAWFVPVPVEVEKPKPSPADEEE